MYANGQGVTKDDAEAVKWYRKAAEQGHAEAQANLGIMYQHGRGIPKDDAEAVKWYRKAAEQGQALGQNNLGWMYANGQGVTKDDAEAVKWYRKAAEQGHVTAQNNLLRMEPPKAGCPPDESSTLGKMVPMYVQWHKARHAQWEEDEVKDPILEAIAKEEEGQEGTAKGRGAVFEHMLSMLEVADSTKAGRVKSGIRASVVLQDLRAGKEERKGEVDRHNKDFVPYLNCLSKHRKAIEYLTTLNQMPNFPDPIVNPEGEIGGFLGAYMRKHVVVDHTKFTYKIVLNALDAYKNIEPSIKQSLTRAASLALIEKALEKLDPKTVPEVRQGHGEKAHKDFLAGEAALQKRQTTATQEYEASYKVLAKEYQEAFSALTPVSFPLPPLQRNEDNDLPPQELRGTTPPPPTPTPPQKAKKPKNDGNKPSRSSQEWKLMK
jgi:hypothetical protein